MRLKDEFGGRHRARCGSSPTSCMTVLTASQLMRLIAADLVRLVSFAITPHFSKDGAAKRKFDENTAIGGCCQRCPTMVAIDQLPCADVVASLRVLAPLRIDQNFASGSMTAALSD